MEVNYDGSTYTVNIFNPLTKTYTLGDEVKLTSGTDQQSSWYIFEDKAQD